MDDPLRCAAQLHAGGAGDRSGVGAAHRLRVTGSPPGAAARPAVNAPSTDHNAFVPDSKYLDMAPKVCFSFETESGYGQAARPTAYWLVYLIDFFDVGLQNC